MDLKQLYDAILLGIVEGLTEFLPVSSTGHLLLVQDLLGFEGPPGEVFPIVIQFGAILAVVAVYFKKFWGVLVGLPGDPQARRFALNVIVAFMPSVIAGVALHSFIKSVLFSPFVVCAAMIAGGFVILLIERIAPEPRHLDGDRLPTMTAFGIGLCQLVSLIPGVSRSGATIMGGLMLGVGRKAAAEFTFYLAVPTMLGATVYDLYQNWGALSLADAEVIGVGFVVSFVAAYVVVRGFIAFISRFGFAPFAWYRIVVGALMLVFLLWR